MTERQNTTKRQKYTIHLDTQDIMVIQSMTTAAIEDFIYATVMQKLYGDRP